MLIWKLDTTVLERLSNANASFCLEIIGSFKSQPPKPTARHDCRERKRSAKGGFAMKSLLTQEFKAARVALHDAATSLTAQRLDEAEMHIRSLRAVCEVIIDLLEDLPDGTDGSDKAPVRK